MYQQLPVRPSLRHLKNEAKALFRAFRTDNPDAVARMVAHHPHLPSGDTATLSDAQLVLAREYGFASWPRLKHHVESLDTVERRVAAIREAFAQGDRDTRRTLLQTAHTATRFERYDPEATSISDADARLLVANQEGYAFWQKYDSYLHLDPAVRQIIDAVRVGDRESARETFGDSPWAANPRWVNGYAPPEPMPNDSIPLFCVAEGSFRGTNTRQNEYELTSDLIAAGAEVDIEGGLPLASAVSFGVHGAVEALLDGGARVDGVDDDGTPLAYALHFGFVAIAETLARRGATLDLRFAAGLGRLEDVAAWFTSDGSLKEGAGALADPYALERKRRGQSAYRCERTRQNILDQALYFACRNGRIATADALLQRGARINAIVPGLDSRATILHLVAGHGSGDGRTEDVIRFLVDRGADLHARDADYGSTPLGWARYLKQTSAGELLRAAGATD